MDESSKTYCTADRDEDQVYWEEALLHALLLVVRKLEKDQEKVRLDQIQFCLEEGSANINVQDSAGNTVLHMAVQKGYERTVEFLLQRGARTDIINHTGETATTLAGFSQNREIISIIIECAKQGNKTEVSQSSGKIDFASVADEPQPFTSRGKDIVTQRKSATVKDDSTEIASDKKPHESVHVYERVHAEQLLEDDGPFSLRRYFISWRRINADKRCDQIRVRNMILCTNWDMIDLVELRKNGIDCQRVEEPDKSFEVMRDPTNELTDKAWYKFPANKTHNMNIYEKLREASDRYMLAKQLVKSLRSTNEDVSMNMPIFKNYHVALVKHVFDATSKTFHAEFKRRGNSSPEVEKFREVFLSEYRKMANDSSIDSYDEPDWDKIENELQKLKLPKNFGLQGYTPPDSKLPEDDCVDDQEIETFLEKFTFTVNQQNENEPNGIIRPKLGTDSQFNLLSSEFLRCAFLTKLFDWFEKQNEQGEEKEYCSYEVGEKLFNEMSNDISYLITIGVSSVYREQIKEYDVHFRSEMQLLKDFLTEDESNSDSNQILEFVTPKATLLTALRIYDTLERLPGYNRRDSFIFTTANILRLSILDTVMDTFSLLDNPTLLVIDCESNSAEDYLEKLWSPLCEIIAKNVKKRMIVIAQTGKDLGTQFQLGRDTHRVQEDDCSFRNLTVASQKKLLGKPVTKFQGRKTEKSFGELSDICESEDVGKEELDELSEVIDSDTLLEIICKNEIPIGEDLRGLQGVDEYYINRTIYRHVVIKKDIFDDKERPDLIAISEISGKLPGISMETEETSTMVETLTNVTTLDRNQEKEQFNALCAENKDRNVHWLMKVPAKYIQTQSKDKYKYIWNKSSGDISYLFKFRDVEKSDVKNEMKGATHVSESDLAARDEPVIISDAAGMGKTTLLTYVANEMKKKEPDMLVIEIDLNRHCKALTEVRKQSNYDLSNINGAIQFLAKELLSGESCLAQKVFERIIRRKRRATVIFDGFDEISPTYEDTVITLLQTLARYGMKKLFVATRPHTRQALESKLNTFSYEIHPLSADNQEDFFTRYWAARFGSHCNSERIKIYAKATMNNLSDSLKDHKNNFTSNPLRTRLVAEIFGDDSGENRDFNTCKEFTDSDVERPNFPKKIDFHFRYKYFVERQFDICFKRAFGNEVNEGSEHFRILQRDKFIETHEKLALVALFEEDKVKQLLPSPLDRTPEQTSLGIIEERIGIITQFINGRPHFGHQTYAEYFAARFFVDWLKKGDHNQSLKEIFVTDVLLGDNCTAMRAFVNMLMSDEHIGVLDSESWVPYLNKYRNTRLGGTIFHVAAAEGNGHIMRLFLNIPGWNSEDRVALLDIKDRQYRTAVQWAFEHGNLNNIKLLSEHTDLKVNSPDAKTGFMPLHISVHLGNLDIVEYLVENKAYINSKTKDCGYTPLHVAAQEGRLDVVKYLVEKKAKINIRAKNGCTPLHLAALKGELDVVKHLVENKAAINFPAKDGYTPLYPAAHKGELDVVKYLVENKAKINTQLENGCTPLHLAAQEGRLDVVEYLVENKADINSRMKDGRTVLYIAAQEGRFDVVKYLAENEAKINFQAKDGCPPLYIAAQKGKLDVVKYLVENGAEINFQAKDCCTPLYIAAQEGRLDVVKYLVENGAEINFQAKDGYTPLHLAAQKGRLDVVEYLVENKAEINSQLKNGGMPLHLAVQEGRLDVVKYLVENKAEINSQIEDDCMPLYIAAQEGRLDVIKYLVENKAEINFQAKDGHTPLHLAAQKGRLDVVKYLVENKAGINSQLKNGGTPLHLAAQEGRLNVVKYLVENRAEINFQAEDGCTPLYIAAQEGKLDVVKYLVENKAEINFQAKHGCTPLYIAAQEGRLDVVKYLVENKAEINFQTKDGCTPLHAAALKGELNVVKYFVENKAEINSQIKDGCTPLHLAALKGKLNVVKYLVENKAKINFQAKNGCTPLYTAAQEGELDVVMYLVKNKAEINCQTEDGCTPLHVAAQEGRLYVVIYLVENKAEISSQAKNGCTPLHLAALKGELDVVIYLVENKAEVNFRAKNGCTPLHLAALEGELDVVIYLVENKAEINSEAKNGCTSLHLAVIKGELDLVKYLVENKAEINFQAEDGLTPLHLAAFKSKLDIVKYLVENKAEINSQAKNGCTPLHLAAQQGELDIVKFLVEKGANVNSRMIGGWTPLGLAVLLGQSEVVTYLTFAITIMLH